MKIYQHSLKRPEAKFVTPNSLIVATRSRYFVNIVQQLTPHKQTLPNVLALYNLTNNAIYLCKLITTLSLYVLTIAVTLDIVLSIFILIN